MVPAMLRSRLATWW